MIVAALAYCHALRRSAAMWPRDLPTAVELSAANGVVASLGINARRLANALAAPEHILRIRLGNHGSIAGSTTNCRRCQV
jgi:hypothetical protein